MPAVEQILAQNAGACVFLKLECDANSGFWQIPLSAESAALTTFVTPFGRYHFNRLPFGITSALEHFQRRMQEVLHALQGVVCLMDDVLVHGKTQSEHDQCLNAVLVRLTESGLTLNKDKCVFSQPQVKFVVVQCMQAGCQLLPERMAEEVRDPHVGKTILLSCGRALDSRWFTNERESFGHSYRDVSRSTDTITCKSPSHLKEPTVRKAIGVVARHVCRLREGCQELYRVCLSCQHHCPLYHGNELERTCSSGREQPISSLSTTSLDGLRLPQPATSSSVIGHMQSIFAQYGIPEVIVSDNGPQYSSEVHSHSSPETMVSNTLHPALTTPKRMGRPKEQLRMLRPCYRKQKILTWLFQHTAPRRQ